MDLTGDGVEWGQPDNDVFVEAGLVGLNFAVFLRFFVIFVHFALPKPRFHFPCARSPA